MYRINSVIPIDDYSNIHVKFQTGAYFDTTDRQTGGYVLRSQGTVGPEVAMTLAAGAGATMVRAPGHGLVAGEWFRIVSCIDCLSADAPAGWRLGAPTSGQQVVYYSEFRQVREVDGPDIHFTKPLVFPIYPVSGASAGPLSTSIIRKQTFSRNFWVSFEKGSGFTRHYDSQIVGQGSGAQIRLQTVCRCGVIGGQHDLSLGHGGFGRVDNALECTIDVDRITRPESFTLDGFAHSPYNSLKLTGGERCRFIYEDVNGSQGFDETYSAYGDSEGRDGYCSLETYVKPSMVDTRMVGMTTHGGSWGVTVDQPHGHGGASLMSIRSPNSKIIMPRLHSGIPGGQACLQLVGMGAFRAKVIEPDLEGAQGAGTAIRIQRTGPSNVSAPPDLQMEIKGGRLQKFTTGIRVDSQSVDPATAEDCGITIDGTEFLDNVDCDIQVDAYNNRIRIKDTKHGPMSGEAPICIDIQADAVEPDIDGQDFRNIGASTTAINLPNNIDRTTFPLASYLQDGKRPILGAYRFTGAVGTRVAFGTTGAEARTARHRHIGNSGSAGPITSGAKRHGRHL